MTSAFDWAGKAQPLSMALRMRRSARNSAKYIIESHPWVASIIIYIRERRWLYNTDYDLLVDGFPRSGNTFTALAFRLSQPQLKVRVHCHRPSDVLQAIKERKPVCLLIRQPEHAVASWIVYGKLRFDDALDDYITYYTILRKYRSKVAVVAFDDATKRFPAVVEAIANKYNLTLTAPLFDSAFIERVHRGIREFAWASDPLQVAYPSTKRESVLQSVKELLSQQRFNERLCRARLLYREFVGM